MLTVKQQGANEVRPEPPIVGHYHIHTQEYLTSVILQDLTHKVAALDIGMPKDEFIGFSVRARSSWTA
ncbi:Uncharacterized protein HZ326_29577 [Fusarium oxysporum f. sp. albedinis]|nr:Uncharacterized protein HZ326_29577 [Fusarium oxysporum f. sp. albedinis]